MRKLDSVISVGHQALSDVTKLCVRECVSKYRVFDGLVAARVIYRFGAGDSGFGRR